jgi:hypothetical protein
MALKADRVDESVALEIIRDKREFGVFTSDPSWVGTEEAELVALAGERWPARPKE